MEFLISLLKGLVFYGILYSLPFGGIHLLKQHYIRALCKYKGAKEQPGAACVICAYHHQCDRASQSKEYKQYSYCRRVLPDQAKALFDEIWEAEKAKESKRTPK